jgi:hypothetical protein
MKFLLFLTYLIIASKNQFSVSNSALGFLEVPYPSKNIGLAKQIQLFACKYFVNLVSHKRVTSLTVGMAFCLQIPSSIFHHH